MSGSPVVSAPKRTLVAAETYIEAMTNVAASVAVVTSMASDGSPRGLTVSAFCSVSLEPPMVLVSVGKSSNTLEAIKASQAFAVNFLAQGAEDVAMVFASSDDDKFLKVRSTPASLLGCGPILSDHITAYFECQVETEIEAGDHWVFIGRVSKGEIVADLEPVVYHRRGFVRMEPS